MGGKDELAALMRKVATRRTKEIELLQKNIQANVLDKFISGHYSGFTDKVTIKSIKNAYPSHGLTSLSKTKRANREQLISEAAKQISFFREMNKIYRSFGADKLLNWGSQDEYGFIIDSDYLGYHPSLEVTAITAAIEETFPEYSPVFSRMLYHVEPPYFVQKVVNLLTECGNRNLEKTYLYAYTSDVNVKTFADVIDLPVSYLYQTFLKRSE